MIRRTWCVALGIGVLVFAAAPASAQVSFGAKAGMNVATADVEPPLNLEYDSRFDWLAGVLVVAAPDSPIGGQVELLFSRRGTGVKVGSSGVLDAEYKFTFIDIPVLLRARAIRLESSGLFILAGPTIGISMEAEGEQSGVADDVSDRFESYDLGLTIGAAFEASGFIADARYTHGLSNYANGSHPALQEFKSRTLSLSMGLRF
jgi:hypothetical protein